MKPKEDRESLLDKSARALAEKMGGRFVPNKKRKAFETEEILRREWDEKFKELYPEGINTGRGTW